MATLVGPESRVVTAGTEGWGKWEGAQTFSYAG